MVAGVAYERTEGLLLVRLSGEWRLSSDRPAAEGFLPELAAQGIRRVSFDTSGLQGWDSVLLAFVSRLVTHCGAARVEVDRAQLPTGVQRLLELAEAVPERTEEVAPPRGGWLSRIGRWTYRWADVDLEFLTFLGQATLAAGKALVFRARFRRSDLAFHLQATGANALPIITLISLIVGLILAFVGALQLQQFGADIFIANLVGIAMLREMGALMTGIIMAGRTGAAFASELGTMKVTEEIDALVTFGIPPIEFLVLPRMIALCLMMPLLCTYANLLGILGGSIVGTLMGLSSELYWQQTLSALSLADLGVGLFKSAVYGILVAVSGCLRGMQASGSASAVGAAATSAVVTAIVAIIVADGLFAVVCNALGI